MKGRRPDGMEWLEVLVTLRMNAAYGFCFWQPLPWVTDELYHRGTFCFPSFMASLVCRRILASATAGVGVDGHRLSQEAPLVRGDHSSLGSAPWSSTEGVCFRPWTSTSDSQSYGGCRMDAHRVKEVLPPHGGIQLGFDLECWKRSLLNDSW